MNRWLICACIVLLACTQATGQAGGGPRQKEVDDFILGNMVWTLYHELGHALRHMLELPNVGREEDAVDGLATVRMIERFPGDDTLLLAASRGWLLTDKDMKEFNPEDVFWGQHGLNLQRRFAIICLLAGSDPEGRRQVALDAGLPEERLDECPGEYESMRDGWERLLAPHAPSGGGNGKGGITVMYRNATRKGNQRLLNLIRDSGLMEQVIDDVLSLVELPEPLVVRFADCNGEAFFDPDKLEVGFCFRFPAFLRTIVTRDIDERNQAQQTPAEAGAQLFPNLSDEEATAAVYALGNSLFAVYHGLALALMQELDLPIVVGEINAADSFAATNMIPDGPDDLADALVVAAANGWYLTGRQAGAENGELPVWSGDDVSLQRYYAVICLWVGSDLESLRKFGEMSGLPGERAASCEWDYDLALAAWNDLLSEHPPSVDQAEEDDGNDLSGKIAVVYDDASIEDEEALRELLLDNEVVQAAVDKISGSVGLPRDLEVVFSDCGDDGGDETFFDADEGSVVVCYGFLARLEALRQAAGNLEANGP